ncbi:MAG: hypothetical protein WA001_04260 [Patescibacteria group bacterium]
MLFAHQTAAIVNAMQGLALGRRAQMRSVDDYLIRFDAEREAEPESEIASQNALAAFDSWADRHNARIAEGA